MNRAILMIKAFLDAFAYIVSVYDLTTFHGFFLGVNGDSKPPDL